MASSRPLVFVIHAPEDERFVRELSTHLTPLRRADELELWHPGMIVAGARRADEIELHLQRASLILVLVSADLLDSDGTSHQLDRALARAKAGSARVVPILVRPALLAGTGLEQLLALPRDHRPMSSRPDRDEAWAEVAFEVAQLVRSTAPGPSPPPVERIPLNQIFHAYKIPTYSRVDPSELDEIVERLGEMREGLVIDGPSGIGKSTAVRIALERLRPSVVHRFVGSAPDACAQIEKLLASNYPAAGGHLIVDDFHLLPSDVQRRIALLMKYVASEGPDDAKVTVVGVNPLGDTLASHLGDIAGRMHRIRMRRQPDALVGELIRNGERAANIEFRQRARFVESAAGSFFIAQLLCYEAAYREGVRETEPITQVIEGGPDGYVTDKVLQRLRDRFHDPLLTFGACDERPPPRGACLVLLWLLSRAEHTEVSIEAASARYQTLRPAFAWLRASNLGRYFDAHPQLAHLFYYNRELGKLSAEDPRLQFYLRHLEWEAFARDTMHSDEVRWDPQNGPTFGRATQATGPGPIPRTGPSQEPLPRSVLLHLSDLHFGTRVQADEWLGQLTEDLYHEFRIARLDGGVIISGDIANRADPSEYVAAQRFLLNLRQELGLTPGQIILVPGNHDVSWSISQSAFASDDSAQRDEARYRERFAPFSRFYGEVRPDSYPLDEEQQATLHHFPDKRLLLLGLNSAWALDHRENRKAGINGVALGHALRQIRTTPAYAECLKIAIFHHPIHSGGEDRIHDSGFLQRLAQAGFRLALHGHLHTAEAGAFCYDRSFSGRTIDIVASGTFGAPRDEWAAGIPLQYQILEVEGQRARVHTRRRESEHGAWQPDARWLRGPGIAPLPYYDIVLE